MNAVRLDHVAIAVDSIDAVLPFWRDALGLAVSADEVVPGEGVRVVKLGPAAGGSGGGGVKVELLEPLARGEGPVAGFLAKKGAGLHHLSFRVEDLEGRVDGLRADGLRFLEPLLRPGSEGHRVAFLHPGSAGGVLVELEECPVDGGTAGVGKGDDA